MNGMVNVSFAGVGHDQVKFRKYIFYKWISLKHTKDRNVMFLQRYMEMVISVIKHPHPMSIIEPRIHYKDI